MAVFVTHGPLMKEGPEKAYCIAEKFFFLQNAVRHLDFCTHMLVFGTPTHIHASICNTLINVVLSFLKLFWLISLGVCANVAKFAVFEVRCEFWPIDRN